MLGNAALRPLVTCIPWRPSLAASFPPRTRPLSLQAVGQVYAATRAAGADREGADGSLERAARATSCGDQLAIKRMLALPEAIRLLSPDVILRETSTRGFPSVICLESREVAALRFLAADPDAQQHVLSVVDHFTTSYECQGLADAGRGFKKLVLVPARGRGLAPDQAAAGAMGGGRAQDDATGNANHRAVPTSPSIRITYNCVVRRLRPWRCVPGAASLAPRPLLTTSDLCAPCAGHGALWHVPGLSAAAPCH